MQPKGGQRSPPVSSVALVAIGLDSSVEVFASLVVVWELRGLDRGREWRALRLIGVGYLVGAAYIGWDATSAIVGGKHSAASPIGILPLAGTGLVIGGLGGAKLGVGGRRGRPTVGADGRFGLIDG